MTTDTRTAFLDRLEALHAQATPGPWSTDDGLISGPEAPRNVEHWIASGIDAADAAAIVAAVNAAPRLVAAVRAAYALAEELEGYVHDRGRPQPGSYDHGLNMAQAATAADLRAALDEALEAGR